MDGTNNKIDDWIINKFRPFAKAWMEIVRNALVVGVVLFVGRKSHSSTLSLFAYFTFLVFGLHCLSFVLLSTPPFKSTANNKIVRWIINTVSFLFVAGCLWFWSDLISKMLFELAELQTK
jgi:hypothetical protein